MPDPRDGLSAVIDRRAAGQILRDVIGKALAQGRAPTGASHFIDGPPGIGKSHLVRDVLNELPVDLVTMLTATADHRRRHDPFAVVEELTGAPPIGLDPAEVAFERIDALCASGPVLVWVDDAHNADAASLSVVRRLVRASQDLPLIVLITARPFPVREALELLVGQVQQRFRLPPLDRMMVERLVYDRTGRWPGPKLRATLKLSAGNPLYVTELLRELRDAGALVSRDPDLLEIGSAGNVRPAGLETLIAEHLEQLDDSAGELVVALAVWGTSAAVNDVAELMYSSPSALEQPLQRTIASGVIRLLPDGTVDFVHDLYREVGYRQAPDGIRRTAHRRVAELLQRAGYRPALVAEHLLQAAAVGNGTSVEVHGTEVLQALTEAASDSRRWAPEVAADLLADARSVAHGSASDSLLLQQVQDLFLAGRGAAAEVLVRQRIGSVTDRTVAAGLQAVLLRSLVNRGDVTAAVAAIDRTLAIPGLPESARYQMEALRTWTQLLGGVLPEPGSAEAALDRFAAAGDVQAQSTQLVTLALIAHLRGDLDRAFALLTRQQQILDDAAESVLLATSVIWPATFTMIKDGPPAALVMVETARRTSAERGERWIDVYFSSVAGGASFMAGDWDDAAAELDLALELGEETGSGWISISVGLRAYIDAHRGGTMAARRTLDAFRHRGLPAQFRQDNPRQAELAVLEAEGAVREATVLARTMWSFARSGPARWAGEIAVDIARVALVGMDRELARQVSVDLQELMPAERRSWPARFALATIHGDSGEIAACAAYFEASGFGVLHAYACEELACATAAGGDRERAAASLEKALDGYARMGAVRDRDRALARTRQVGLRRGSREAHVTVTSGWAGLTRTERRIAALVREGLTNPEIATRLFVSPRTVQTHVSHILAKTGLRSRVEVAAAARTELG